MLALVGIGPLAATALVAAVGEEVPLFRNARGLAAWLGLVPGGASACSASANGAMSICVSGSYRGHGR